MVPDKFNMVDMGGIDLIMMQGEEVPGLYNRLVESIAQCRYQCLYNWLFDGVIIPPTYVEMEVNENEEVSINEGVTVSSDDVIHIYTFEPQIVIEPLSITENGEYTAPSDVDGYNPVIVNVESAGEYPVYAAGYFMNNNSSDTLSHTFTTGDYMVIAVITKYIASNPFTILLNSNDITSEFSNLGIASGKNMSVFTYKGSFLDGDVLSLANYVKDNNAGVNLFIVSNTDEVSLVDRLGNTGGTFSIPGISNIYDRHLQAAKFSYYSGRNTIPEISFFNNQISQLSIPTPNNNAYWYGGTYVLLLKSLGG